MTVVPDFSDIHVFWELDSFGRLTVAIRAPLGYLRSIGSPTEVLFQFMAALHARGVETEAMTEVRTRIDKGKGTFVVRWTGQAHSDPELVRSILPELTASLGAQGFGEG